MMKNDKKYKMLTGEKLNREEGIQDKVTCYMDDVQNIIGHKRNTMMEKYINQLNKLLIVLYSHNFLKIHKLYLENILQYFFDDTSW